jgi:hypothetical protein
MYISILKICHFLLFYFFTFVVVVIVVVVWRSFELLFCNSQLSHDCMGKISDTFFKGSSFHPSKVPTMDCTLIQNLEGDIHRWVILKSLAESFSFGCYH